MKPQIDEALCLSLNAEKQLVRSTKEHGERPWQRRARLMMLDGGQTRQLAAYSELDTLWEAALLAGPAGSARKRMREDEEKAVGEKAVGEKAAELAKVRAAEEDKTRQEEEEEAEREGEEAKRE